MADPWSGRKLPNETRREGPRMPPYGASAFKDWRESEKSP